MLLAAWGSSWRRRRSRCWSLVKGQHPDVPIITFTNHRPVTLGIYRTEVLAFDSRSPTSGCPHLFAIGSNVRGILIDRRDVVAQMDLLEHVRIIFLDCLPAENRSSRCHQNSVLREVRGHSGGIVLVKCISVRLMRVISRSRSFGSGVLVYWDGVAAGGGVTLVVSNRFFQTPPSRAAIDE